MLHSPRPGQSILVFDPSSDHTAYCIIKYDVTSACITEAGMLWTGDWTHGRKFWYINKCIEYLILNNNISHIKTEAFFMPGKFQMGVFMIPTVNNMMKSLCYAIERETRTFISVEEVSPSAWRKTLAITPVKDTKGKRDYKAPARLKAEQILGKDTFPATVVSNFNLRERALPHDLTDVICIALAMLYELRVPKITLKKEAFNNLKTIKILNSMI